MFDHWMPELEYNVQEAVSAMNRMKRSRKKARDKGEKWIGIRGTVEKESPERDVNAIPDAVILQSVRFEPTGEEMVPSLGSLSSKISQQFQKAVSAVKGLLVRMSLVRLRTQVMW